MSRAVRHTGTNQIEEENAVPRGYPLSAAKAIKIARAAGYEPAEPYPGLVKIPWKLNCMACGKIRSLPLNIVRWGGSTKICKHLGTDLWAPLKREGPRRATRADRAAMRAKSRYDAAVEEIEAAGYEFRTPYTGRVHDPQDLLCTTCGEPRRTSLDTIRSGAKCKHRVLASNDTVQRPSSQRAKVPDEELRRLYESERLSIVAVSEKVGVSRSTVRKHLIAMGVRMRGVNGRDR